MTNHHESRRRRGRSVAGANRRSLESLELRQMMTAIDPTAVYSAYVTAAYHDVLGRGADAGGVGLLDASVAARFRPVAAGRNPDA